MATHLALEVECRRVRVRPLRPQRVCQLLRRPQHLIVLLVILAPTPYCLVEFAGRVKHRRDARRVVMNARVDYDRAVSCVLLGRRREAVYATGLNVDRRDFGTVVFCEDGEFNGAAPCLWFEDGSDVFLSWTSAEGIEWRLVASKE